MAGMRTGRFALGVLLASIVLVPTARGRDPQPGPPPAVVDDSPTGFSCTVQTLLSGAKCVLDFDPPHSSDPADQAAENVRGALSLSHRACLSAVRSEDASVDPDLLDYCQKTFETAANTSCSLGGARPLLDGTGRFATGSTECYEALGGVLSRVRSMTALTARCCRCVSQTCGAEFTTCNEELADDKAEARLASCAVGAACSEACSVAPGVHRAEQDPMPPVMRPSKATARGN